MRKPAVSARRKRRANRYGTTVMTCSFLPTRLLMLTVRSSQLQRPPVTKRQVRVWLTVLDTTRWTANTSEQMTSQGLAHSSRQDAMDSEHKEVKTVDNQHISTLTIHFFTTDQTHFEASSSGRIQEQVKTQSLKNTTAHVLGPVVQIPWTPNTELVS